MGVSGVEKFVSRRMKLRILCGDIPNWMKDHPRARYLVKAHLAAPLWARGRDFKALREEARRLSAQTGVVHVLDHIIPVDHPMVCGLTVPWNIQVVPYGVNAMKGNYWNPDQMELPLEAA